MGLPGLASHTIKEITPPRTSKPATMRRILAPLRFLRLRKELILLDGEDDIGGLFIIIFLFTWRVFQSSFPCNAM
jgi:hypothetical protein